MTDQSNLLTLSFARSSGRTIDLWPETPTSGTHAADNEVGRARADEVVSYMRDNQAPMVLGHVVDAMIRGGRFGAVEVGFHNRIALHAMGVAMGVAGSRAAVEPADMSRMGQILAAAPASQSHLRLVQATG